MLELTKQGMSRESAYKHVQKNAKKCFQENKNLLDLLLNDKIIIDKINEKKLKNIFVYKKHFKNINYVFKRLFK